MALYSNNDTKKRVLFAPFKAGRNKTMASRSFPASISIPAVDSIKGVVVTTDINNPMYFTMLDWEAIPQSKKKEYEPHAEHTNFTIRYIYGEQSIFADKQKLSDEQANNKLKSILIYDGVLAVNADEIPKIKYLRNCNYNYDNPYRLSSASPIFSENDLEKTARIENEKIDREIEASSKVSGMTTMEMEMLALSLSDTVPQFKRYATMDGQSLKRELLLKIRQRPEVVDRILNDADMKMKAVIAKGFAEGIWEHNQMAGTVVWGASKTLICNVSSAESLIPSLVDYTHKDKGMQRKFDELTEKLGEEFDPLYNLNKEKTKERKEKEEIDDVNTSFIKSHGPMAIVALNYVEKGLLKMSTPKAPAISSYWVQIDEGDEKRMYRGINKLKEAFKEGLQDELENYDGTLQHV